MRMGFPKNVNVVGRIVIGTALTVSTAFISGMAEQKLAGASEPVPAVYFGCIFIAPRLRPHGQRASLEAGA